MKNTSEQIITRDNMAQRVAFEILVHYVPDLTIKKAKDIAYMLSVQIRNTFLAIENEGLSLNDEQAHDIMFWIEQVKNSGKSINHKQ